MYLGVSAVRILVGNEVDEVVGHVSGTEGVEEVRSVGLFAMG